MGKVKDDKILEKSRLVRELRSQMQEKEELISTAKAQLQSLSPQPQHLRLRPSNPRPGLVTEAKTGCQGRS